MQDIRDYQESQLVEVAWLRDEMVWEHTSQVLNPMQYDEQRGVYHQFPKAAKKGQEKDKGADDRGEGSSSRKTQEQQDEGE